MNKLLKILLAIGIILLISAGVFYLYTNETKPDLKTETASEADVLANKMLEAINIKAWDSTNVVQWSFKEVRDFIWDKQHNYIQVKWDEIEVRLNLDDRSQFLVFKNQLPVTDTKESSSLAVKAWEYFCNDSFWLNAPAKVFDSGTKRSIVKEDGVEALMVMYESGGATPGDSYVWFLDENFRPYKFKMWVSIIPIGGTEATWAKWEQLPTGAMVSTEHEMAVFKILIRNLKAAQSLEELGVNKDLFVF